MLSAAKIVAEVAGIDRFRSRAAFARWNGTAPIPVWTGSERFRLNRGGNRQVNAAIRRIAITKWRGAGPKHDYILRRIERGDTKTAATARCADDSQTMSSPACEPTSDTPNTAR
ncbi:MAG: transposase [Acidimicrobiia bacterium]|nr:transposase [Acidimicrobiia bacterium]